VTFTCQYEDVKGISDALDRLQEETGLDVPMHVDGASGAFLAPFCLPELEWDFRLPRVKSINASGHKFGLAPLGVGWIVWRDAADLPEELVFNVNYLGGNMPTFALNFSRPGGQIAAQYYIFLRLGREGYTKVQSACYDTAAYMAAELAKMGPFRIIYDGDRTKGIPAVAWTLEDGADIGASLYDLADKLRARGWQVPAYSMPANREDLVVQRALIRHGVSRDLVSLLLEDIRRALAHFRDHPVTNPLSAEEATSYHH
jgi:glutamate decarboxylase